MGTLCCARRGHLEGGTQAPPPPPPLRPATTIAPPSHHHHHGNGRLLLLPRLLPPARHLCQERRFVLLQVGRRALLGSRVRGGGGVHERSFDDPNLQQGRRCRSSRSRLANPENPGARRRRHR